MTQIISKPVGVIGLGSIGKRHTQNLRSLGERVYAFDPLPEASDYFYDDDGVQFVSLETLWKECAAVVIASPNQYHLEHLELAITHGLPSLVEKPLGHDLALAKQLVDRAEACGVPVVAAFNLRFRKTVEQVSTLLADHSVGEIVWARFTCGSWLPGWRPDQDYRQNYAADPETGGVIFDIIHELDLACYLLGKARVTSCCAVRTGQLDMASEDLAEIILTHDTGAVSSVHLDYITRPARRDFIITGRKGILQANLRKGSLTVVDHNDTVIYEENIPVIPNEDYHEEMKDFLEVVRQGGKPRATGFEAVNILENVMDARAISGLPGTLKARKHSPVKRPAFLSGRQEK